MTKRQGGSCGTFSRFEDILAWQKARAATKAIYVLTNQGSFAKDFGLRDQIRRSSVSIMANIAEGYGRRSDKEFSNFLNCSWFSSRNSVASLCGSSRNSVASLCGPRPVLYS